jgi:hypothetical protein
MWLDFDKTATKCCEWLTYILVFCLFIGYISHMWAVCGHHAAKRLHKGHGTFDELVYGCNTYYTQHNSQLMTDSDHSNSRSSSSYMKNCVHGVDLASLGANCHGSVCLCVVKIMYVWHKFLDAVGMRCAMTAALCGVFVVLHYITQVHDVMRYYSRHQLRRRLAIDVIEVWSY